MRTNPLALAPLAILAALSPTRAGGELGTSVRFDPPPAAAPGPHAIQCPPSFGLPADGATWCETTQAGADGVPRTADDRDDCVAMTSAPNTDCATRTALEWTFDVDRHCADCTYVLYVAVDSAAQLHLWFDDAEAMAVTVRDMETGVLLELAGENECSLRRSEPVPPAGRGPFAYCDGCPLGTADIYAKDDAEPSIGKPASSCTATLFPPGTTLPEVPCLQYRTGGTTASWGRPADVNGDGTIDADGDGYVDEPDAEKPPCMECSASSSPPCPCSQTTGDNRMTDEQLFRVTAAPASGLSGVYRVEMRSGARDWRLFANCDGTEVPQLELHADCATASAALAPPSSLPELTLDADPAVAFFVADASSCPASVTLAVTTCNLGDGPSASAPFRITFDAPAIPPFSGDNAAHPTDPACQGDLLPGECRTCEWSVPLGAYDVPATVVVDPDDVVAEASESLGLSACWTERDTASLVACEAAPPCIVTPQFPSAIAAVPEGDCALRLTWDPATGDPPITYDVYRDITTPVPQDAAHLVAAGLTDTTLLDTPAWGTSQSYRVVARTACASLPNAAGDSIPVSPVDATPPGFAGVSDTRDLGGCQVEVSWSPGSDACSGVAAYDVYRDHGVGHAGETLVGSSPTSPFVDTVPGNGVWVYVVRARDAAGNVEGNDVFQQESEGSCTNDFPRDAGLDREDGIDSPNADRVNAVAPGGGTLLSRLEAQVARTHGTGDLRIRWKPSPDEGGLYPVTYTVLTGDLLALRTRGYTHALVDPASCGLTAHEHLMADQVDGVARYYLVAPVSGDNATFGYDWTGREIPAAATCE